MSYSLKPIKDALQLKSYLKSQYLKDCEFLDLNPDGDNTELIIQLHKKYSSRELTLLKMQKTCMSKYGTPYKNNVTKAKATTEKKYGSSNFRNIEKAKQTCLEKYGTESVNSLDWKKEKTIQTVKSKYGVDCILQRDDVIKSHTGPKSKKSIERQKESYRNNRLSDLEKLEKQVNENLILVSNFVQNILQKDSATFNNFLKQHDIPTYKLPNGDLAIKEVDAEECLRLYNLHQVSGISEPEKEIVDFLKSIYTGPIKCNDRNILEGKELDIYLPEKNLAIEFNGTYWHSDKYMLSKKDVPSFNQKEKARLRHLEKTQKCQEKNIRLLHIFSDDWNLKKDIWKDIIKQSLGIRDKIIFARKCELKNIDASTYKNFLEENHLQGYSPASVKLGLFFEDQLVECIGFKLAGTHSNKPELVRLCTKIGYNVTGGFSKLVKHSGIQNFTSYIDVSTFTGDGYNSLGFKKIKQNDPTYFYIKLGEGIKIPRQHFMKKYLKKLFEKKELEYFNDQETEEVNMYKNGYAKVWNCGTILVEYSI